MKVIYLDNCATTRVDDEVLDAMLPYLRENFGNPSSPHILGKHARRAVDAATEAVADLLRAEPEDIVFTSGTTEGNNIALLGAFDHGDQAPVNAVFTPTDHKSSLSVAQALSNRGIDTRMVAVHPDGRVDLDSLAERLDADTRIATTAWVNSEIGTIQPVDAIVARCRDAGCLLHVDATQAAGRIPIDVADIDMLAISGHKMSGPKGVGALSVRPDVRSRLRPIMFGGGQYELRSGTVPTHLVVGLGKACELAQERLAENWKRAEHLRDLAVEIITKNYPGARINGDPHVSVPHVLNVVLPGVRGESLVAGLHSVALATGSACNSTSQEPSHVLRAIGLDTEDANSSIRLCFDPGMAPEEVARGVTLVCERALGLSGVAAGMLGEQPAVTPNATA